MSNKTKTTWTIVAWIIVIILVIYAGIGQSAEIKQKPSDNLVLIDFCADWCGPCRAMDATIAAMKADGYKIAKVNVDINKITAERFHVKTIPCFVLLRSGKEVGRIVGLTTRTRLEFLFCKYSNPQEK